MHRNTDIAAQPSNPLAVVLSDPERLKELDIDKLERLLSMQRQLDADAAKRAFHAAFTAVQSEVVRVQKRGVNTHTRSAYALAEDVFRMLDPVITRHGFSRSLSTEESPLADHIRFVLIVRHEGGHREEHRMDAPIDNIGPGGKPTKTRLHGMASSYTYCERHLVMKVFGVETGAVDDDGNSAAGLDNGGTITEDQALELDAMLTDRWPDDIAKARGRFCRALKVAKIADLPAARFNEARQLLEARR